MVTKTLTDVREEITSHIKHIERNLHWLSKKTDIAYSTLYSVLIKKERSLSEKNKSKINEILGTDY